MNQLLSVSKAARLVNVRRSELQRRIKAGEINTFEGQVQVDDLLRCYPDVSLNYSAEFERVQQIKDKAFGKRVLEHIMPDPQVLVARVNELGRELLTLHTRLSAQNNLLDRLQQQLSDLLNKSDTVSSEQLQVVMNWLQENRVLPDESVRVPEFISTHRTVLKVMAPHVRLLPSENEFFVEGSDSILEAGLREGLAINYGCSNGNCGLCKARVISGEAIKIRHYDYQMTEAEKHAGYLLMCSHTPVTDMVIEATEAGSVADLPVQQITTRIKNVEQLSDDMLLLHLQTPRTNRLRFFAGQSVELTIAGGRRVSMPVASCPCDDRNLHFHIRRDTMPELAEFVQKQVKKGDALEINGPYGNFVLEDGSTRPLLMIAEDDGFAPIKSLVEHALAMDDAESIHLYRIANDDKPYLDNLCRSWADALDNLFYHSGSGDMQNLLADIRVQHTDPQLMDIYVAAHEDSLQQVRNLFEGHERLHCMGVK